MWDDRFADVCRGHEELLAVYESAHGRLALLLDETLVPLDAERGGWLARTRAGARRAIADLRAAGFSGNVLVLQWLPMQDLTRIVARWVRRWDADPPRRSRLLAAVEGTAGGGPGALDEAGLEALKAWYETMAPCWLAIQPVRRRRLVLQAHVWIAERVLGDPLADPGLALGELGPEGPLTRALERHVPRGETAAWRRWIELVRLDLERALRRPAPRRTQAWARWLFLIPYSIPVVRRPALRVVSGGARAVRPA
jgi:hypothetical protein